MPPQIDLIQLPKELGRRNGEPGLADDDMAVRHRVQILKDLAPSFGQRGTARDAESHIRADFFGKRLQLFPAHVRAEQPIHSAQHRCRVRRTACHPRTDGDFFLHADTDPLVLNPLLCAEQLCRPHGKIAPVGRNVPEIAGRADSGLTGFFQLNGIGLRHPGSDSVLRMPLPGLPLSISSPQLSTFLLRPSYRSFGCSGSKRYTRSS